MQSIKWSSIAGLVVSPDVEERIPKCSDQLEATSFIVGSIGGTEERCDLNYEFFSWQLRCSLLAL